MILLWAWIVFPECNWAVWSLQYFFSVGMCVLKVANLGSVSCLGGGLTYLLHSPPSWIWAPSLQYLQPLKSNCFLSDILVSLLVWFGSTLDRLYGCDHKHIPWWYFVNLASWAVPGTEIMCLPSQFCSEEVDIATWTFLNSPVWFRATPGCYVIRWCFCFSSLGI